MQSDTWIVARTGFARVRSLRIAVLVGGLLACVGCHRNDARLRVFNDGPSTVEKLTVLFPRDEVKFGDVAARSASAYATVRHGVGPNAAFRFVWNGAVVEQEVIDFIGWKPVSGVAFTYHIRLEESTPHPFVRVISVVKDR